MADKISAAIEAALHTAVLHSADVAAWADAFDAPMRKAEITNANRIGMLIGQCSEECGRFAALSENLNYSATALMTVFGSHFGSIARATGYARQPERIANRVYANRLGNSDEASGDGWRFRGAGAMQLTGRTWHTLFAEWAKRPLDGVGDYMRTIPGAAESSVFFWEKHGDLNAASDVWDIYYVTKRINGGLNGYAGRIVACTAARTAAQEALSI